MSRRIVPLDILRGFALCGILLIHVPIFANPGAPPGTGMVGLSAERIIPFALIWLVEGKFFSLFAAMFGVSFALIERGYRRRPERFAPFFRRRSLLLAAFGVLHVSLLWEGDILLLYALVGLALLPMRGWSRARAMRWVRGLIGLPLLAYTLAMVMLTVVRLLPASAEVLASAERAFQADFTQQLAAIAARYASDAYWMNVPARVWHYLTNVPLLLTRAPTVLALFLFGYHVARSGFLADLASRRATLRRAALIGFGVGLPAGFLVALGYAVLPPFSSFTLLAFNQVLAGPMLALGYASGLLLLLTRSQRAVQLLQPLAAYGRMGLTVYLTQSLLCALLFYGVGAGWVGRVTPPQAVALAVGANVALIMGANVWLARFERGPLETVWRRFSRLPRPNAPKRLPQFSEG